jgi:methionine synthase II (cobalamin-independent)
MKVKELIEKLKEYSEDMNVEIWASYDCGFGSAGGKIQFIEQDNDKNAIVLCNEEG